MKLIDAQGRLFGKFNLLDVGAALTILLVLIGIFVSPGTGRSAAQVGGGKTQPVEVDLIVRGLSVRDPQVVIGELRTAKKTNIVVRNQPAGSVEVKTVEQLPRKILVTQPDGTLKLLDDPRPENMSYSTDLTITLAGNAVISDDGVTIGNTKMRIGTPIELEGRNYGFNATTIDVRVLKK